MDYYNEIFKQFKEFINNNSIYSPRVVKVSNPGTTYFPIITVIQSNTTNTSSSTVDRREHYDAYYFTIEIYTKDKTGSPTKVASQVISNELTKLTNIFFGEKLNMNKTLQKPTPNLDNSIDRTTIQYQCYIGNVRGNIIRR